MTNERKERKKEKEMEKKNNPHQSVKQEKELEKTYRREGRGIMLHMIYSSVLRAYSKPHVINVL